MKIRFRRSRPAKRCKQGEEMTAENVFSGETRSTRRCTENPDASVESPCLPCLRGETGHVATARSLSESQTSTLTNLDATDSRLEFSLQVAPCPSRLKPELRTTEHGGTESPCLRGSCQHVIRPNVKPHVADTSERSGPRTDHSSPAGTPASRACRPSTPPGSE